jgi:hypothetical protein
LESSAACFCPKPKLFATYAIIIDFSLSAVKEINFFRNKWLAILQFSFAFKNPKRFSRGRQEEAESRRWRDSPFLSE